MTSTKKRYQIVKSGIEDNQLAVTWGDGHRSQFHPLWLRHQCECTHCGSPINGVRGLRILDIPEDLSFDSLGQVNDEIQISWLPEAHVSVYRAGWLRDHCYSDKERAQRKHRPALWDGSIANNPPEHDFDQVVNNPAKQLAMLESVRDFGFCKVNQIPTDPSQSHRLIALVGDQRQSHYGSYLLSKKEKVDNVGDVTFELPPHADETYRLSCIGITIFQVWNPSTNGGDSTLVDGFEAARRLRANWPQDFELLAKVPIITERLDPAANTDGKPRWFRARLPLIKLDDEGEVSGVHYNERQIAPLDMPADLIEPYYRALRRLFSILYDPELMVTFKLVAGQGLLFDNQRILHGRTAFTADTPPRSVLTSSVDLEEFHSTMRLLQKTLGVDSPPMLFNQGMVV